MCFHEQILPPLLHTHLHTKKIESEKYLKGVVAWVRARDYTNTYFIPHIKNNFECIDKYKQAKNSQEYHFYPTFESGMRD